MKTLPSALRWVPTLSGLVLAATFTAHAGVPGVDFQEVTVTGTRLEDLQGAASSASQGTVFAPRDSPRRSTAGRLRAGSGSRSPWFWAFSGFEWLQKRLPLARRVVGAWCLAIALLLGALAIRMSAP